MPFIQQVSGTSAPVVIAAAKAIFSEKGVQEKMISDNCPFNSYKFKEYAKKWGLQVLPRSPQYPDGHGHIEMYAQL